MRPTWISSLLFALVVTPFPKAFGEELCSKLRTEATQTHQTSLRAGNLEIDLNHQDGSLGCSISGRSVSGLFDCLSIEPLPGNTFRCETTFGIDVTLDDRGAPSRDTLLFSATQARLIDQLAWDPGATAIQKFPPVDYAIEFPESQGTLHMTADLESGDYLVKIGDLDSVRCSQVTLSRSEVRCDERVVFSYQ